MEFKSLKNIESSFRQLRLFGMIFLVACTVVTVWSVWSSYSFAEKQREKIYVLDGGKSLMLALSQDLSQNRPAEAREHVRRFHELFFTLAPEKSAIESNVQRALVMADKSAYNYYRDFAEQGFYNRIIAGNINQTVRVDSVVCDFDNALNIEDVNISSYVDMVLTDHFMRYESQIDRLLQNSFNDTRIKHGKWQPS